MHFYPLFADLNGRLCLAIGRGNLIEEKSRALRRCGALVRRQEVFSVEEAEGVFLIVADVDEDLAAEIKDFGDRTQIFVNVVDKPKYCSFVVPAIAQQSDLLIAICTSGKSPSLAGWIRERIQTEFGPEYGSLLDILGKTRNDVKKALQHYGDRKAFYRDLLESDIITTAQSGGSEALQLELNRRLQEFKRTRSPQTRP
jgi:siroheme synthase-like protein